MVRAEWGVAVGQKVREGRSREADQALLVAAVTLHELLDRAGRVLVGAEFPEDVWPSAQPPCTVFLVHTGAVRVEAQPHSAAGRRRGQLEHSLGVELRLLQKEWAQAGRGVLLRVAASLARRVFLFRGRGRSRPWRSRDGIWRDV